MKKIVIGEDQMIVTRSTSARMGDKYNRALKLAVNGKTLLKKCDSFINVKKESWRKQCALAFKVMYLTGIRVGSEDSAQGLLSKNGNEAFGLTTLRKTHIKVQKGKIVLDFTGKKNVEQSIAITNKTLVKQLSNRLKVAEEELFDISDYHMRKFMQTYVGKNFLVKDLRTMRACMEFSKHSLSVIGQPRLKNKTAAKKEVNGILEKVSDLLGNTPAICRKSYIDPIMIQWHMENRMGINS